MTDTTNTYGDPRADHPGEWIRPVPAPTADDYRTAARVLRSDAALGGLGNMTVEAEWCEDEAARLDPEEAKLQVIVDLTRQWISVFGHMVAFDELDQARQDDALIATTILIGDHRLHELIKAVVPTNTSTDATGGRP